MDQGFTPQAFSHGVKPLLMNQDDLWGFAYTQALLLWLNQHGYTPNTIPDLNRRTIMELARDHAMKMADLAIEAWLNHKAPEEYKGGSMVHLLFDTESTELLVYLQGFTDLRCGEVIRNALAVYDWIRERLHDAPEFTITREMCPHLAPKPTRSHLRLV
jgi:hypothetical protein